MPLPDLDRTGVASDDFDYSTPEALAALEGVTGLVTEIRNEFELQLRLSDRKVRLYERTLGLAVIPVLIRRTTLKLFRRPKQHRQQPPVRRLPGR